MADSVPLRGVLRLLPGGVAVHDRVAQVVGSFGAVSTKATRSQGVLPARACVRVPVASRAVRALGRAGRAVDRAAARGGIAAIQGGRPPVDNDLDAPPGADDVNQVDDEVHRWLSEAWQHAAR